MTQAQLASGRYTKAYVSALENGLSKPSVAALGFFAERLHIPLERFLADEEPLWTRLQADLYLASGDWTKAVDAFEGLLAANPSDRARAELLLGSAEGLARLERAEEAVNAASTAEALLRAQDRPADAAWATYWQSFGLYLMEQSQQAVVLLERILDAVAAGLKVDADLPVRALIALATNASRDLEPERALGYLEQARGRLGDLDERKRAVFLWSLAISYHELGDFEAAIAVGTRSLATFRVIEADREAASLANELALVYLALGSLDKARRHAKEARSYFEGEHDERWLAHVTETDAQIALASGSVEAAATLAGDAQRLAEQSGDRKAAVSALLTLGRAQRAGGDLGAAATTLAEAAELARSLGRRAQLQAVLTAWGEVMAESGDMTAAYRLSREAVDAGRR